MRRVDDDGKPTRRSPCPGSLPRREIRVQDRLEGVPGRGRQGFFPADHESQIRGCGRDSNHVQRRGSGESGASDEGAQSERQVPPGVEWKGTWPVEFWKALGPDSENIMCDGFWSMDYPFAGAKALGEKYFQEHGKYSVGIGRVSGAASDEFFGHPFSIRTPGTGNSWRLRSSFRPEASHFPFCERGRLPPLAPLKWGIAGEEAERVWHRAEHLRLLPLVVEKTAASFTRPSCSPPESTSGRGA